MFDSWVQGPIARNLGGEPAMTVVPNLAVTAVLNIVASLALIAWAVWRRSHPRAGTGLVVLSAAMLLVGGGFGPLVLGMLAGLVAGAAPDVFVASLFLAVVTLPVAALDRGPHIDSDGRPMSIDDTSRGRRSAGDGL